MPRRVFIDSWGWFAYFDKKDEHHRLVEPYLGQLLAAGAQLFTADPVLIECLDRARGEDLGFSLSLAEWFSSTVGEELVKLLALDDGTRKTALLLRLRHASHTKLDFVDCCSAALMEKHGLHEILSGDPHFRILRPGVRLLPEDDEPGAA